MNIALLTPGTGSYHCGVCMRDNALAKELIRQGHDALMLPMYLPLTLDEKPANKDAPIFFGGINVYLQQKSALFRNAPRWIDKLLNSRALLRFAGSRSSSTNGADLGEITLSMLKGEEGQQAKELEKLVEWLRSHARLDAIWLSTALLVGLARELKRALGVPVLASLQGEDAFLDDLPEPWRKRCWDMLAERARDVDAFIAPSRYYGELMNARMQLSAERLRVIPNGIALEGYEQPGQPQQPPVIGFLARMFAGKGLGEVIDAFILLRKGRTGSNVRLCCAGSMTAEDASYVDKLKQKLESAGLGGDVEFLPNISREEKIAFLKKLTLLSVPAKYGEAFGLYLIEALAAGVPVVQPRTAAFPEIIEATGGGVLYDAGNAQALADAWEQLLSNPLNAQEMGLKGREAVKREFSISRMAERFLDETRNVQSRGVAPKIAGN